eukprot:677428-Pelagomonas_calceolata.AAC.1
MVNGKQVRSHLRRRLGKKEERAIEQGSTLKLREQTWEHMKLTCCSSCISSWASQRSQVGNTVSCHVACSTLRVWSRRQNQATP